MPATGSPFNPYNLFIGSFLPNALLRFPGLSHASKLVWSRLAQYAGEDGRAFPKVCSLASELAMGERQALRLLQELEHAGFLRRIKATGIDRLKHFSDTYIFLWHPCLSLPPDGYDGPDLTDLSPPDLTDMSPPSKRIIVRESKKKEPPISPKGDAGFDQFWQAYPRREAKVKALSSWKKLKPSTVLLTTILTAIERMKVSPGWQKDEGQFIPLPASWLNGRRWEDEPEVTLPTPPEPPGEFDHLPRISGDFAICGCDRQNPEEVCRAPYHGLTVEEHSRWLDAQAVRP